MPSSDSTSRPNKKTARSIVYIDGFNLYYGAIKGGPNRWLDLEKYFRKLRHDDEVKRIYYFTAVVSGSPRKDQAIYLRALATLPLVEIRLGRFKLKDVECRVRACTFAGQKLFKMPEEKQTDVAIGIQMVLDAVDDNCDRFVLVTGDSDLLPAVRAIKLRFPKKQLILYVPATRKPCSAIAISRPESPTGWADSSRSPPLGDVVKLGHYRASWPHLQPSDQGV